MSGRPPQPRWRRRAEARPEEILDAALAEFTERGFDAARMEDIGRRAGLSKAGVYLYFPSKMALLEALIQTHVGPLAANIELLAEAGAPAPMQALRVIAAAAAHRLADPNLFAVPRLVIGISGRFPQIAKYYREHVVARARAALQGLIETAIAKGEMRRVETDAVVRAFIGPLLFEAMWTYVLAGETALGDPQKLIESQFDVLLKGLELSA